MTSSKPEADAINPDHYKGALFVPRKFLSSFLDQEGNLSMDSVDLMIFKSKHQSEGFLRGNAVKYVERMGRKESLLKDAQKAVWYILKLYKLQSGKKDLSVSTKLVESLIK